jgi:hypothetical protein
MIWPALRSQDVPVTTLKQTGLFTLPSNPSRISRVASGGGILWFLVTNSNWSELLATDVAGGNPNQFAFGLPIKRVSSGVNAICASADGRIAVWRTEGVEIYSRAGVLAETIPFDQPGSKYSFDEDLWVWSRAGLDALSGAQTGLHIALPDLPKYAQVDLLKFKDRRLGFLESTEAALYMADQQTGNWLRHRLDAPEFQQLRRLPPIEDGAMPFIMSPSVAGGEFYVLVNGINRNVGARVLRFDSQGNIRARYLCPLPTSVASPTATNPDGVLSPVTMVVMDRTLLLISSSQKAVASYSLE